VSESDEAFAELSANIHRQSGPGRPGGEPPLILFNRELTQEDLERLEAGGEQAETISPSPLTQLRYKHHSAARLLAKEFPATQVAAIVGYKAEYISSHLLHDPAFIELVEHYRREKTALDYEVEARLAQLGMSCAEEIQGRLDAPDRAAEIGTATLADVMVKALDRSVAPPKRTLTPPGELAGDEAARRLVVNHNFAEPPRAGLTIEAEAREEPKND
jgi:hypothetical protein